MSKILKRTPAFFTAMALLLLMTLAFVFNLFPSGNIEGGTFKIEEVKRHASSIQTSIVYSGKLNHLPCRIYLKPHQKRPPANQHYFLSKGSHEHFKKIFELVGEKVLEKEAIEIIFESIMSGKAESIEESIQKSSLKNISDEELEKILEVVVQDNLSILQNQGSHAIGTLMGIAMKTVRGKASGEKVNQILKKKIQDHLNKK